ncbi:MAG: 2Fe-2S iron-sulfur cluster-binding protein [Bacteroidetes bacterium]|nr:2Fe-2S iron-sulfur cluster-binding protein [Rhodothermia bacterium]MCX7907829.1 2Fe-2S iron-sulfur cluster-binding protein [Bacteroidota bacterium]MDW8284766.1 2Fe-2S iron-sulfur cluster-binding protein [Bacteroidota bacterium]
MPKVYIDDDVFEFEGRPKILEFCLQHGIELPYFCYHPALSIPANCRQCLVEVGQLVLNRETGQPELDAEGKVVVRFFPKLMPSCATEITDGMVVRTHRSSALVRRAQRENLEFILLNHPLDCPICDQAGECPLQELTYKFGPDSSRFEFVKVHKPKRIPLGPRVVLDAERCINCTRCVRFTEEISRSRQLTIIQRGDKNYPFTAPGMSFDDPYSMNTIDICPVGALTSADFRFRARAWEMASTPSICTGCARGCSIYIWTRHNRVERFTPRHNPLVNDYWMCDEGRLSYRRLNENRLDGPHVRESEGLRAASWEESLRRAAHLLRSAPPEQIAVLASASLSLEDLYVIRRLAFEVLGTPHLDFLRHEDPSFEDAFLRLRDRTPNRTGCELVGISPGPDGLPVQQWPQALRDGRLRLVLVFGDDPLGTGAWPVPEAGEWIVASSHWTETASRAQVLLALCTHAEATGCFVNQQGVLQRVRPAKASKGMDRTLVPEMGKSRLDHHATPFDRWWGHEHYFDCRPGWELAQGLMRELGSPVDYTGPEAVFAELAQAIPALRGLSYAAIGLQGVRLDLHPQPVA